MNPAPPVTSTFIAGGPSLSPRPPGTRASALLPVGGSAIGSRRSLPSSESGGRGAGRPSISVVPAITRDSTPAWSKISWAKSNHEQRPAPAMWWMPYSSLSISQRQRLGEVRRVGRASRPGR